MSLLDSNKHLRVGGVLMRRHPETGLPWTEAKAKTYIEAMEEAAASVDETEPEADTPKLVVAKVTGLSGPGLVGHKSDFSLVTVTEGQNVTMTGTLSIDDRTFTMPIRREEGGYKLFPVEVKDGQFTATLNFPTSDVYYFTDAELNKDLPEPLFTLPVPVQVDVLRAVVQS